MQPAIARPVQPQIVRPPVDNDGTALNPTATRYGWAPFTDISLVGPDGTPSLYVQDHRTVLEDGSIAENPLHRVLPRGHLLPFPTFQAHEMIDDPDRKDNLGRPVKVNSTRPMRALDAIVLVLRQYSSQGFVMLNSLQGLDPADAQRIFEVVQPFVYPLGMLEQGLQGADERIDSTTPMIWDEAPGYVIEPLRNDGERAIARQLQQEMLDGASVAVSYAQEILSNTEISMTTRLSGGTGKAAPDQLDRRLSEEFGRELPKVITSEPARQDAAAEKIDFLVERAKREDQEKELAELRAENERLKAGGVTLEPAQTLTCGYPKADGSGPCRQSVLEAGERCKYHADKE